MSADLSKKASWEAGLGGFIKQIFHSVPEIPADVNLQGQTAIVTGSSTGLGRESARQFLQQRLSTLIIAVRSQAKGDKVAQELRADFPKADIRVWIVDMASCQSVRDFAAKCETLERLDIAVLNAGGGKDVFQRAEGGRGREMTLQVNYLSTVLLALLLLPIMASRRAGRNGPAHLSVVGSDTAHQASLEPTPKGVLDIFEREEKYEGMKNYAATKLLLLMFVAKLAEFVDPEVVIVSVVNPGAVKGTDLLSNANAKSSTLMTVIFWFVYTFLARNVTDGARQYLLATLVMGKESHGSLVDFQVRLWSPIMYTDKGRQLTESVWLETLDELKINDLSKALGGAAR